MKIDLQPRDKQGYTRAKKLLNRVN